MSKSRCLLFLFVLLAAGAVYFLLLHQHHNPTPELPAPELAPTAPLSVKATAARRGTPPAAGVLRLAALEYTRAA